MSLISDLGFGGVVEPFVCLGGEWRGAGEAEHEALPVPPHQPRGRRQTGRAQRSDHIATTQGEEGSGV